LRTRRPAHVAPRPARRQLSAVNPTGPAAGTAVVRQVIGTFTFVGAPGESETDETLPWQLTAFAKFAFIDNVQLV
jgi:hypothetical protein